MSAFQCSPEHIGALASLLTRPWRGGEEPILRYDADPDYDRTGGNADSYSYACRILWQENAASLAARYPTNHPDPEILPTFPRSVDPLAMSVQFPDFVARVIKSANCYRYQACEHDGWERSKAHAWTEALIARAVRSMRGYSDAPWGAPFERSRSESITRI